MREINGPLIFHGSGLETFRDCREKARLRYEELLQPKKKEAKRNFGTAFHAAVETFHLTEDKDEAERTFVRIAREGDMAVSMDADEPRTIERGLNLFNAYLYKWRNEPFKILRDSNGKPFVEIRFSLHLFDYKGYPVLYSGVIDKIAESGGRIYMPDLKTTRRSLNQFQNSMRPNHKLTGYYVGAKDILGDTVFAVGYDAVFISKRKPNPKKGGWMTYGVDIDKDFMRTYTTRTQRDVDNWLKLTRRTIMDYIHCIENEEAPWDQNAPNACWRYGRCDYLEVCNSNQNEAIINSLYDKVEWHTITETRQESEEEGDTEGNEN